MENLDVFSPAFSPMVTVMADLLKTASPEALEAGKKFIERLKSGIIKKNTLPNTSDDYPLEKASENYSAFLESEQFKALIKKKQ